MTKPPVELLEFLRRYDGPIQSLALGLRALVLDELAPRHEHIFAMRSKIVLLYGKTERAIADCVCSISVFTRHVTLTFHRGAELQDTHGLLKGTGKIMRHMRVVRLSELDRPELRAYLAQARKHAGLTRPRGRAGGEVVTRVKHPSTRRMMDEMP